MYHTTFPGPPIQESAGYGEIGTKAGLSVADDWWPVADDWWPVVGGRWPVGL
jgi:hypothetical protein